MNTEIENTELYNMVLQAMDNYQTIILTQGNGAIQFLVMAAVWDKNGVLSPINNVVSLAVLSFSGDFTYYLITPASTENLYVPVNISPVSNSAGGSAR